MSLVYLDNRLTNCYNTIYKNIVIDYQNIFYRKDIGLKYINNYNKKNKNKLNYIYILTPKGIFQKTKSTIHFMNLKLKEYDELQKEYENLTKNNE